MVRRVMRVTTNLNAIFCDVGEEEGEEGGEEGGEV